MLLALDLLRLNEERVGEVGEAGMAGDLLDLTRVDVDLCEGLSSSFLPGEGGGVKGAVVVDILKRKKIDLCETVTNGRLGNKRKKKLAGAKRKVAKKTDKAIAKKNEGEEDSGRACIGAVVRRRCA